MSAFVRRTIAASLIGVAAFTSVGMSTANAGEAFGILACTDQFVDDLLVREYLSCVA